MFWDRFESLCTENGYTPNGFARKIGISSGIIAKWKATGSLPKGENLIKIADGLNCSIDYLLGRSPESQILNTGSISYSAVGDHASNNIQYQSQIGAMDKEIISLIQSLPLREKTSLLSYAYELSDKTKTPVLSGTSAE